jgi:hypothetical protein
MEEVTEIIVFDREDVTAELMEAPFQRKAFLGNKFGLLSRFSDGEWPAFYTAIGRRTAQEESAYHYGRKAAGAANARRTVHYSVVRCTFLGDVVDLRSKLTDWPDLVSDDYTFCNGLGREAQTRQLEGFLCPSARDPGGTTLPAFKPEVIAGLVIEATASLTFNTGRTDVHYLALP